jgi:hypothetical protein
MPSETAETIAPAAPWTKRAVISSPAESAVPHSREAAVKTVSPATRIRRRPSRSPSRQQQTAEGDQVGVHHPGQAGLGEAQVTLDGRQRDGHDRAVEDDHQSPRAEYREGRAAGTGSQWHEVASWRMGCQERP